MSRMNSFDIWEKFCGSQPCEEFMDVCTNHGPKWSEKEIEEAVLDYMPRVREIIEEYSDDDFDYSEGLDMEDIKLGLIAEIERYNHLEYDLHNK